MLPRHAGDGVEHVALTLFVDDVVEEGAKLSLNDFGAGVGGDLYDLVDVKFSRQRRARAVQHIELAQFSRVGLRLVLLGDIVALDEDAGRNPVISNDRFVGESR